MKQAIVVKSEIFEELLSQLKDVKLELGRLRKSVEGLTPVYGSEAWWEQSTTKAIKEASKGEVYMAKGLNDALRYLKS